MTFSLGSFTVFELNTMSSTLAGSAYTVGQINFEDKKFRGFHGYLLNLKIKYPCNFLHNHSGRFFVQHVHMVGKWLALCKYFKQVAKVKTPLPSPTLAVRLFRAIFSCRAYIKEVQCVIGTINDGPLYLLGAFTSIATL